MGKREALGNHSRDAGAVAPDVACPLRRPAPGRGDGPHRSGGACRRRPPRRNPAGPRPPPPGGGGPPAGGRRDDIRLASTAGALGVLRAQQGHTVRALIEDVAALRTLLTLQVAASDSRHRIIDDVLAAATTGYVDELTAMLESQATRDPLTGLPNRAGFNEVMGHEISSAGRTAPPALLLIDLDGFKGVNDTDGHLAGDAVLRGVADVLTEVARSSDVACRLGGDEFAVVLPRTTQRQAMTAARRLLAAARCAEGLSSARA